MSDNYSGHRTDDEESSDLGWDDDEEDDDEEEEDGDYREAIRREFEERQEARQAKIRPYISAGRKAIQEMLERYGAVTWTEIIARAGDYPWGNSDLRIDPHHLQTALNELTRERLAIHSTETTRGGRRVTVIVPPSTYGRRRDIERAAARKRLLAARYLGWASGDDSLPGLTGAAAEDVVHQSLREAAPEIGYRLANPVKGSTSIVLGGPIAGGPVDNAATFYLPGSATQHLLVIEVKSLRTWVYPSTGKLYQLLRKAARLSTQHPNVRVIPVFVCRKAHFTTFRMARDLGFHVISTLGIQWLPQLASIDESAVIEVRQELGFADLRYANGSDRYLVKQFAEVIPATAERTAQRWHSVGSRFADVYDLLSQRLVHADQAHETHQLRALRSIARVALLKLPKAERTIGKEGGW